MSSPRPAARTESVAGRFRAEIERAEAGGLSREAMTLHLTRRDVSQLKRDRNVDLADISFAGGVMKYLDVKVEEGGVETSALTQSASGRPLSGSDERV